MARKPRNAPAGQWSHVSNRGNDGKRIFHTDADYDLFVDLMAHTKRRFHVSVAGFCAMPTHFHALIKPERPGALSEYMQWVLGVYAFELRARTATLGLGHVFQRRFWNGIVYDDFQFLATLRYIERNPVRESLVLWPDEWRWSSFTMRLHGNELLDALPTTLPSDWERLVLTPQGAAEVASILRRQRPGQPPEPTRGR